MKYKIFYTFKGGSDNSKNNSIENVEDIVRKTNLEEEQNPIDKVSTSSEIPLTDKEQVKRQKEKDKKKRRKERKKAEKAQENTPSVSSTSTSTTSSENNSNN